MSFSSWSTKVVVPEAVVHDYSKWRAACARATRDSQVTAIELGERLFGLIDPAVNPRFHSYLCGELGILCCEWSAMNPALLRRGLELFDRELRTLPPDAPPAERARVHNCLGNVWAELPTSNLAAALETAIDHFKEALSFLAPEAFPSEYAMVINNLGIAYYKFPTSRRIETLSQAIAYFETALQYRKPESEPEGYAATLTNLGDAYIEFQGGNRLENWERAVACFEEASRYRDRNVAPLDYAATRNSLGIALYGSPRRDRGTDLRRAIDSYLEAHDIYKRERAPRELAAVCTNLGLAYAGLRDGSPVENLDRAERFYRDALKVYTAETTPHQFAATQVNLGLALAAGMAVGRGDRLEQAIDCFREALRIYRIESAPFYYAIAQNGLGGAYRRRVHGDRTENLEAAIECYREALRVHTIKNAPRDFAVDSLNLANALLERKKGDRVRNLSEAIDAYSDALEIFKADTFPADHGTVLNNLAMAHGELGSGGSVEHQETAVRLFEKALTHRTVELVPLEFAMTCHNLGNAFLLRSSGDPSGNAQEAIRRFDDALRLRTEHNSPLEYAMTQNSRGAAFQRLATAGSRDALDEAIRCFRESLRFRRPEVAPRECIRVSRNLASALMAQKKWQAAREAAAVGISAGKLVFDAGLSQENRALDAADDVRLYHLAAVAACRAGDATDGLLQLEQGRMRTWWLSPDRPVGLPDSIWSFFLNSRNNMRRRLNDRLDLSNDFQPQTPSLNAIDDYETRVATARDAGAKLKAAIDEVRCYDERFLRPVSLSAIQLLVARPDTALISFALTEFGTIAFLVLHDASEVRPIEVPGFTSATLGGILDPDDSEGEKQFEGWIESSRIHRGDDLKPTIDVTISILGKDLIRPIVEQLPDHIHRLILIPSGGLYLLPLHAIPLADGRPLGERYEVTFAPSAEVLIELRDRIGRANGQGLYAAINPQNDDDLPMSFAEATGLRLLFPDSVVQVGADATLDNACGAARGRAFVHFGCHGSYDWLAPESSGIRLSDGTLTLADLRNGKMDLSAARLVTLSACETGISDAVHGSADEYVGLPSGFLLAGVPCVLSALWQVEELSAMFLIEEFYRQIVEQRVSFAAALRNAQQRLRNLRIQEIADRLHDWYRNAEGETKPQLLKQWRWYRARTASEIPFDHPYYWAAFELSGVSGDPAQVVLREKISRR